MGNGELGIGNWAERSGGMGHGASAKQGIGNWAERSGGMGHGASAKQGIGHRAFNIIEFLRQLWEDLILRN
ncbi:hypothetical protein QUB05_11335 [Microcoleus sp. F10-C6]|uniref:hypothetical protein n=1 Tax=Microcoleus sp. F10-C6 TaxID=2818757 RepID=UPI002FD11D59